MTPEEDLREFVEFRLRTQMAIGDHRFVAHLLEQSSPKMFVISLNCPGCNSGTAFWVYLTDGEKKTANTVAREFGLVTLGVLESCQETVRTRLVSSIMDI